MDIAVGDTFLREYPGNKKHLHIIVTERTETGCFVCVFVSSIKPSIEHDNSCVLHAGELGFIKHESYVVYDKIQLFTKAGLELLLANGTCIKKGDIASPELISRIKAGALSSDYMSEHDRAYFE